MDTSQALQDITKSVDQLCGQISLSNVVVPKIDTYDDVFDFLNEFETVTATLPDEQKKKLLVKAFPVGRKKAWFEDKIKLLIDQGRSWKTIKDTITKRYSDSEERDRHFKKLNELKYDPKGKQKLFDHVEDLCYSFSKAFPNEKDEDTKIRYIKSALPSAIKPSLSIVNEYTNAKNLDDFMRGIRQYDSLKVSSSSEKPKDKQPETPKGSEICDVLKELILGVRREGEATRSALAAFRNSARSPSPRSPQRYEYRRSSSPKNMYSREQGQGQTYNRARERSASPNARQPYQASPRLARRVVDQPPSYQQEGYKRPNHQVSTTNQGDNKSFRQNRDKSPSNYYRATNGVNTPPNYNQKTNVVENSTSENKTVAFDDEFYFNKFGMPPRLCSHCGYMHWERHCHHHLNE